MSNAPRSIGPWASRAALERFAAGERQRQRAPEVARSPRSPSWGSAPRTSGSRGRPSACRLRRLAERVGGVAVGHQLGGRGRRAAARVASRQLAAMGSRPMRSLNPVNPAATTRSASAIHASIGCDPRCSPRSTRRPAPVPQSRRRRASPTRRRAGARAGRRARSRARRSRSRRREPPPRSGSVRGSVLRVAPDEQRADAADHCDTRRRRGRSRPSRLRRPRP